MDQQYQHQSQGTGLGWDTGFGWGEQQFQHPQHPQHYQHPQQPQPQDQAQPQDQLQPQPQHPHPYSHPPTPTYPHPHQNQNQHQHQHQRQHELEPHASAQYTADYALGNAASLSLDNLGPVDFDFDNMDFTMGGFDDDGVNLPSQFGDMGSTALAPTLDASLPAYNGLVDPGLDDPMGYTQGFIPQEAFSLTSFTPMSPQQTVSQQTVIPQTVSQQTVSPQAVYPQTVYPQTVYPQTVYPQTVHPQTVIPQTVSQQTVSLQTVYPQTVSPQAVMPQAAIPQEVNPQVVAPQTVYPQTVSPQAARPQAVIPQEVVPQAFSLGTNAQQNTGAVAGKRARGRPRGNRLHGEEPSDVSPLVRDSWKTAEASYLRLKRAENRLDEFKKGPADGKKQLTEVEKEREVKKMEKCVGKNRSLYQADVGKYRRTKESEAEGRYDHLPATNDAEAKLRRCQERLAARKAKYTQAAGRRGISPADETAAAVVPANGGGQNGSQVEVATEGNLVSLSTAEFNKAEAMWTYSAERAVKEQEHIVARCRERDRAVGNLAANVEFSEWPHQATPDPFAAA